jgi:dTDP-glucose 4,6-dehydratase
MVQIKQDKGAPASTGDALMPTILVTGGAGFIGSCFVRRWLANRCGRVVNLDKLTYAGHRVTLAGILDNSAHSFVEGDITDGPLVCHLLKEHNPQAIVHFAAETHVDRSIDGPAQFVTSNVLGTCTLLDVALRYWNGLPTADRSAFRFLHVSTDEVFGTLGAAGCFTESTPYAPRSPYAASKAAANHFVRAYHTTYGLPTLITHSSNNYGPYQYPEKLVPVAIQNALARCPVPVYGDGRHVRDWLFVEDHCRALEMILGNGTPGETFCIGGDCERTNLAVVAAVCDLVDELRPEPGQPPCRNLISLVADRPGHDRRYASDATKLRSNFGWQPQTSFVDGLRLTVDWYLNHRRWVETVTRGSACDRLGLSRQPASSLS